MPDTYNVVAQGAFESPVLIYIWVYVTDSEKTPIANLSKNDFRIFRARQYLIAFDIGVATEDYPEARPGLYVITLDQLHNAEKWSTRSDVFCIQIRTIGHHGGSARNGLTLITIPAFIPETLFGTLEGS